MKSKTTFLDHNDTCKIHVPSMSKELTSLIGKPRVQHQQMYHSRWHLSTFTSLTPIQLVHVYNIFFAKFKINYHFTINKILIMIINYRIIHCLKLLPSTIIEKPLISSWISGSPHTTIVYWYSVLIKRSCCVFSVLTLCVSSS